MMHLARATARNTPALRRGFAVEVGSSMLSADVTLQEAKSWDKGVEDGFKASTMQDIFAGKKVVLFAVPGAYTGVCSQAHVPSYIKVASELKAKGVDTVACVSVNDPYTMSAWSKQVDPSSTLTYFGDSDCSFTKFVGKNVDLNKAALGPGERSNRYSMLVENGSVTKIFAEAAPSDLKVSDGETMLKAL
mmetsp:Transcript_57350/g.136318  ORF Transcript_57350/g.136318 Transcript_57350/m.136318 type:complete len:190 (+) Transcript_57350:90-659(+)|eukprot:CAMPEP_0178430668 /NCGR_PEP_ID=MMETSP0689_2-20121128/31441_1 /TAXON_ID=160604 /ORGANISM="Amphidinium massartii, Strain CS-259" /LENGTH=189 /DNA_ID=CAMNT_0020052537 /DNA_START=90 /DNA_END=659 /DNA_ORIENTATION=+